MCQKESWGTIFATEEAHSTQRGQPPRMHGPGLWRYKQKEQRVTPVPMSRVNCDLWCPGLDSKDLGGRPEQDPGYTSKPDPGYTSKPYRKKQHCAESVFTRWSATFPPISLWVPGGECLSV